MKRHIKTWTLSLLLLATAAACYEDKGNYDYNWVPGVSIAMPKELTVSIGERLRVEPMIFSSIKKTYNSDVVLEQFTNPDDYTYAWEAWTRTKNFRGTLGTSIILDTTINLAISTDAYWILFKVTEKTSGVEFQASFMLTVKNEIATGLVLLYDDAEGKAELDVAGITPAGEDRYVSGLLAQQDYPYRDGGANFVEFEKVRNHLWVGTGTGAAWLNPLTFAWKDTQMAQVHMTQGKPVGYTFKDMIYTYNMWYFITEEGELSPYTSNGSATGTICASINLLPPGVSAIDGQYQEVIFAPYVGGGAVRSGLVWDATNKRMLKCPINVTEVSTIPVRLADSDSFHGHELRFMANTGQITVAILKAPTGEYLYATYVYNSSSYVYDYRSEFTRAIPNTNGVLDQAKNMIISRTPTPYLYFSVGNKLYVYRDSEGCVEVNLPSDVSFGEITCVVAPNNYTAADLVVAANNPGGEGGALYTFTIDPVESKNLTLVKKIEGTPAGVKDVTYLY
jgi:hypothetical protein